jgi:hypothetical protein
MYLARYRYLDSHQIRRLCKNLEGGSDQRVGVRLTKLHENEFIGKPFARAYKERSGRAYDVYGLRNPMAKILPQALVPRGRIEWSKRTKTVSHDFLRHTLETSELLVTFETSVRQYPKTTLRHLEDLWEDLPPETQALELPWYVESNPKGFPQKTKGNIKPDAVFGVRYEAGGENRDLFFMAEIDCNTMTITRGGALEKNLQRALLGLQGATSDNARAVAKRKVDDARYKLFLKNLEQRSCVLKKFLRYFWAYKHGWFEEHFGWPNIRILFVTTDASHVDSMIRALHYVTEGQAANLFLFASAEDIRACDDIFTFKWKNGVGDFTTLMS